MNHQLPALKREIDCGNLHVDNIDVFCEKGVFDVEQTKRILSEGIDMGLQVNFHGDELHPIKSAEVKILKYIYLFYSILVKNIWLISTCYFFLFH